MVEELESSLLGPTDVAVIITALAENACDGGVYVYTDLFIETTEGQVVLAPYG